MRNTVESAVSECVKMLIPKGSCTPSRWLTFEFEAINDGRGAPFNWSAQYSAPSGYIDWRTLIGCVPHVKLEGRSAPNPWIPEELVSSEHLLASRHGEKMRAPGFVIADGSHDSCWRDNASTLRGYPLIPKNCWRSPDGGRRQINYEATNWCSIRMDTVIKVRKISVLGPVETRPGWTDAETLEKFAHYTDGVWVNDTGLTGQWAIFHGLSKLAHTVGQQVLGLRIRGRFDRGVYGKRSFREESATVQYQMKDGLVTHRGILDEKNLKGWVAVEKPYLLDEEAFLRDCGVKVSGRGAFRLTHVFPDVLSASEMVGRPVF